MAQPNYVAKKSIWSAIKISTIIFCWLIFPVIIMLVDMLIKKHERIEFYDDYVVVKSGVLAKKERRSPLIGIVGVSISQSFRGRIFKYGDIFIDIVGRWDINTKNIANPNGLKEYLEPLISKSSKLQSFIMN